MSLLAAQAAHPLLCEMSTLREELEPALAELPTRQRQVLSLRYLAGLDEADVSEALGISVRAVRKYQTKGVAALRAHTAVRVDSTPLG